MNRPLQTILTFAAIFVLGLSGCHPTQPFYLHEDGDLSHYLDTATDVSYPDVEEASLDEVTQTREPLSLGNPDFKEFWDLTLEDVTAIALQNSKVIRGGAAPFLQGWAVVSPGNDTLANSAGAARFQATVFDPAVRESEAGNPKSAAVGFMPGLQPGQLLSQESIAQTGGVEAALSEFDAHISTDLFWDKTDRQQVFGFPVPGSNLEQDNATFRAEIKKKTATGTHLFFRNTTQYTNPNEPFQLRSGYTTALEMEARQPLFRGRGTQVNRIAVITARIGTDQQIAQLEWQVQNMLTNLEIRYWDLHCAYRALETAKQGRDSALVTWRNIYAKQKAGLEGTQAEAQAREQYFFFRSQAESALCDLYSAESDLRWLMGLASTDGRLIRPIDEATQAKIEFEWPSILAESLGRRPVLRSQKWEVKKRELQLIYARNALLPEVNAVALYRWFGIGDELISANRNGLNFPAVGSTAVESLTEGDFQELRFGVEFNMPVGFRRELAGVRNAELKLTREKAALEDMELDVARELTQAVRAMDAHYHLAETHFNRWIASEKEVEAFKVQEEADLVTLDLVLDAQRRRADAQIAYYRALCEYNKAIALLHRRKGSITEYCGVQFGEGPWNEKAYWDALGHARRRDAAHYLDYGWTRPNVVSRGSESVQGLPIYTEGLIEGETLPFNPAEEIPAGEPTPADPSTPRNTDAMLSPRTTEGPSLLSPLGAAPARPSASGPNTKVDWNGIGLKVPQRTPVGSGIRQASHAEPATARP